MSFRIWKKGEGTATPAGPAGSRSASGAGPAVLARDLVDSIPRRIVTMAVLAAGSMLVFAFVDRNYPGVLGSSSAATLWVVGIAGAVGSSLVITWIAGRSMLSPDRLLDAALVYEVLMGFFFSLNFHAIATQTGVIVRGWSAVAVWVLAYPLIVPATRGKVILAAVATAAMDPLGFLILGAAGARVGNGPAAWLQFLPTAASAAIAIIVSRIVHRMNVEAEKGHEMGSYHLEELLGRGGMGEVWKASHRLLARSAAIKLIRPDSSGGDGRESIKRFEREVKAAAGLQSPHTVDIYDYGTTEDGTFYYVMELLEGFDLETLVERFGPVPAERAVYILVQACLSLAEAHQGGLIHRDVKPANIYVCRYGLEWDFVKLLDFGLVKNMGAVQERQLTNAGVIAGTPGYMAPEMGLSSPDLDWRADIYALGAVGYWLVTGALIFDGKRPPMQIIMDHIQKSPPPPSSRTENAIPAELDAILLSCLQKDPHNRPQTMQELAKSLRTVPFAAPWTEDRARRWWLANGRHTRETPPTPPDAPQESMPRAVAIQ
ncbi:MAG: serine/threonine protein kinase [Acidobacteriota bacterium]|nr:serine/threonine protein kinase [Acidobacteriota bacterium]